MTRQQLIERQTEYIHRIQQGERQVIPDLWELLRPLTARYIQRYIMQSKGERLYDADDLWQESYIALVAALDYWQPDKGAFSKVYLWALQNATRAIRGTTGHDAIFCADSLDKPLGSDGESETTRANLIEDTNAARPFEDVEQSEYIRHLHQTFAEIDNEQLAREQQEIIQALYYDRLTASQTAERLGISYEQCKAEESRVMRIYRRPKNRQRLTPFLLRYSGVGLTAFRERQASSVELMVERLDRLRPLADMVSAERRQRWEREREYADTCRRWGGSVPEYLAERWQRYISGQTNERP